jgi:hypothetical protein
MKSSDVNSDMKYLMIVDFRGDVRTNFANIGIMKVMENRKLGNARKIIGWVMIVNLKVGKN